MKVSMVVAPLALVVLVIAGLVALGTLGVRSAAMSTSASIELLEIHRRVSAMHQQLTGVDHGLTQGHVDALAEDAGVDTLAPDETSQPAPASLSPVEAPLLPTGGAVAPDFLLR